MTSCGMPFEAEEPWTGTDVGTKPAEALVVVLVDHGDDSRHPLGLALGQLGEVGDLSPQRP